MAVTGRPPKDADARVNRHVATHEWLDVPDVPYRGSRPRLPADMPRQTQEWWRVIGSMPHCVLWGDDDWQYAKVTALLHAAVVNGRLDRAAELRIREMQMGVTFDARRNLRIRYVEPQVGAPKRAKVTALATARWRRLTDAG